MGIGKLVDSGQLSTIQLTFRSPVETRFLASLPPHRDKKLIFMTKPLEKLAIYT
jgi:hypothetical protein